MGSHKNLKCSTAMAVFVVVLMMATTSLTEAQSPTPSCATNLVSCAEFINNNATTKPNTACCSSIKNTVEHDLPCLCSLYNSPGGLSSFGVNISEALRVSRECNVDTNLGACNRAQSPSQVPPPPGVSGDSGAGRVAWTVITSLLLFWASMMLY